MIDIEVHHSGARPEVGPRAGRPASEYNKSLPEKSPKGKKWASFSNDRQSARLSCNARKDAKENRAISVNHAG
jgi:hypothetical protein